MSIIMFTNRFRNFRINTSNSLCLLTHSACWLTLFVDSLCLLKAWVVCVFFFWLLFIGKTSDFNMSLVTRVQQKDRTPCDLMKIHVFYRITLMIVGEFFQVVVHILHNIIIYVLWLTPVSNVDTVIRDSWQRLNLNNSK